MDEGDGSTTLLFSSQIRGSQWSIIGGEGYVDTAGSGRPSSSRLDPIQPKFESGQVGSDSDRLGPTWGSDATVKPLHREAPKLAGDGPEATGADLKIEGEKPARLWCRRRAPGSGNKAWGGVAFVHVLMWTRCPLCK